jgi:hypothetical protein
LGEEEEEEEEEIRLGREGKGRESQWKVAARRVGVKLGFSHTPPR